MRLDPCRRPLAALLLLGCSARPTPPSVAADPAAAAATVVHAPPPPRRAVTASPSSAPASAGVAPVDVPPRAVCPAGMEHVQTSFCPELERECLDEEYDRPNRITICHAFREGSNDCRAARVPLDFCIDQFEFPNQRGGKPPVMVSFYDAERSCADVGKRVCTESEWVAACEGPEETPFPYGWRRSPEKCNIDNKWVSPNLARVYSKDPAVQQAELQRLDQSVPSGARPECRSGFGVFDLTGNFDEWVRADQVRPNRRSRQAGLKGGAWGHVRNACRPVTTSHRPDFEYYFISFRCCADAAVE